MTESPADTLIASPDAVITDAQGNVWSLQNGQVVENGIPDPTTANVIALAYAPTNRGTNDTYPGLGQVWQEDASGLWWAATDAGWSPPNGSPEPPVLQSVDSTVIMPGGAAILDFKDNIWSISDGQVVKNGVADPTTANVIAIEYKNGIVWQENASNLWWYYSQASDGSAVWIAGSPTAESPYNTLIATPDAVITDAQGNTWSLQNGQVVKNGIPDASTANVIALAYASTGFSSGPYYGHEYGQVYQENASGLWWQATDAGWSPPNGSSYPPVPFSADSAIMMPGDATPILDSKNNIWTIIDGQVVRDGVADPTTANVIALEYKNGVVWQENADQLWWSYSQAADGSSVWTPGTVPVNRVWIGGDDNNAWNPNDWSPNGAPAPADTLTMTSGTMNICGNALAGDTLTIPALSRPFTATVNLRDADVSISAQQGGNTLDVNVSGGTSKLALNALMNTVNVVVAPDSTLIMDDHMSRSTLNVSGGTIEFIGYNGFSGFETVFNDSLVGTGTIGEYGGNAAGEFMEVNGPVGCGLTFDLSSYLSYIGGPRDVGLQIDRPDEFHGTIGSMDGSVAFMGLHATSGEILNDMLKLFDGDMLVDAIHYTGPTSSLSGDVLKLQQTYAGVTFSIGHGETYQPGGSGGALPLTISS